ncbi:MAG: EAL domain-containing protein, partial [Erysipelotrichaceae bacterium]
EFYNECLINHNNIKIKEVIDFFEWYVFNHFKDEEEVMKEVAYPYYKEHKMDHDYLLGHVIEQNNTLMKKETSDEQCLIINDMFNTILEHTNEFDQKLASFIQDDTDENRNTMYITDKLTHLPIRKELTRFIKENTKSNYCILIFHIENLGSINDYLGQNALNIAILVLAKILEKKNSIFLAHYENNDFCMIINTQEKKQVIKLCESIIDEIESYYHGQKDSLPINIKIGIVNATPKTDKNNFINAQKAIRHIKNTDYHYAFYNEQINEAIEKDKKMLELMQPHNLEEHVIVMYQPVVALNNTKTYYFECLARLKDFDSNLISPNEFIPIAEENHLMKDLGYVIFDKSLRMLDKCRNGAVNIAVNISLEQFKDPDFFERLDELYKNNNIDESIANRITYEITETILAQGEFASLKIEQLKKRGAKIEIDDFGSGYSSFDYLYKFDIDGVKIDKAIMDNICDNYKAQIVMKSIINMIHSLHLEAIAEGVENEYQYRFAQKEKVDYIQGFFFSKAMDESSILNNINYMKKTI